MFSLLFFPGNRTELGPAVIDLILSTNHSSCIHGISSFQWGQFNGPLTHEQDLLLPLANQSPFPIFLLLNDYDSPTPSAHQLLQACKQYGASGVHLRYDMFDVPGHPYVLDTLHSQGLAVRV